MNDTGLPQARTEEESILAYRMGQIERTVGELKLLFENSNLAVLAYKVAQLEIWRNRIVGLLTTILVLVISGVVTGAIEVKVGGK